MLIERYRHNDAQIKDDGAKAVQNANKTKPRRFRKAASKVNLDRRHPNRCRSKWFTAYPETTSDSIRESANSKDDKVAN